MTDKRARRLIRRLDLGIRIFEKLAMVAVGFMFLSVGVWLLSSVVCAFLSEDFLEKVFFVTTALPTLSAVIFCLICLLQSFFCGGFYLERLVSHGKVIAVALKRQATCFRKDRTLHIFLDEFPESQRLNTSAYETEFNLEIVRKITFAGSPFHGHGPLRYDRTTSVTIFAWYEFSDLRQTLIDIDMAGKRQGNFYDVDLQLRQKIFNEWHALPLWSLKFTDIGDFLATLKTAVRENIVPKTPVEVVFQDYSWKYTHIELDD